VWSTWSFMNTSDQKRWFEKIIEPLDLSLTLLGWDDSVESSTIAPQEHSGVTRERAVTSTEQQLEWNLETFEREFILPTAVRKTGFHLQVNNALVKRVLSKSLTAA